MQAHLNTEHRHSFITLFEAIDSNPNGDPDNGGAPRQTDSDHGLVTGVCLKRKVRDYVALTEGERPGYGIYIQNRKALETQHIEAYKKLGLVPQGNPGRQTLEAVQQQLLETFFDIRLFGGVLASKKADGGKVKGPITIAPAKSVDPVVVQDLTLTRRAITKEAELLPDFVDPESKASFKVSDFGSLSVVQYGLYRGLGAFNPYDAVASQVTPEDLAIFWTALANCFVNDASNARANVNMRKIVIFSHDPKTDVGHRHVLEKRLQVFLRTGIPVITSYEDYNVLLNTSGLAKGLTITVIDNDIEDPSQRVRSYTGENTVESDASELVTV